MNTYGFTTNAGYIGGSGVCIAEDKETALIMINKLGKTEPMSFQITMDDIIEVEPGTVYILTNGDY